MSDFEKHVYRVEKDSCCINKIFLADKLRELVERRLYNCYNALTI